MATLLTVIQTAAKRCGISNTVSTVIGNANNNIVALLTKCEEAGKAIRDFADWPELQKQHSFTLATSTDSYALPADFDRMIDHTQYNRDQIYPVYGPITPEMWQYYKSGQISLQVNERYRVKGWTDAQFFVDPTPDAGFNGNTLVYEYISKTWIRPKTWVASTVWTGIQYCSHNGNIYDRGGTGAGSTGTTPPTHTSGAVSDGGITWTYTLSPYEVFVHDSDQIILDEEHLINATVWRWKMEKGYAFEPFMIEAQSRLEGSKSDLNGACVIDWRARTIPYLLDYRGLPEGSYG